MMWLMETMGRMRMRMRMMGFFCAEKWQDGAIWGAFEWNGGFIFGEARNMGI